MELSYWQGRWDRGEIGFHEAGGNDLLVAHAHLLDGRQRVLVPLCGKSVDMTFLAERGMSVVGIEAVRAACSAYFADAGVPEHVEARGPFAIHRIDEARARGAGAAASRVQIAEGDVFAAHPDHLGTFDAAYDRAALIALAPDTRARYVDVLRALLRPRARLLLVTVAYDQRLTPGPPWSIDDALVKTLFRDGFVVEKVLERPAEIRSKLKEAGVQSASDGLYRITRL